MSSIETVIIDKTIHLFETLDKTPCNIKFDADNARIEVLDQSNIFKDERVCMECACQHIADWKE